MVGNFFQLFVGDGGETAMAACSSVHPTRPVLVENVLISVRKMWRTACERPPRR
jgi:hypothetical protein